MTVPCERKCKASRLIAEYDAGNGSLKKEYFYRGGQLLATIESVAGGATVKFWTPDHLGSVREWTLLDGSLVVDGTHDYTPFGTSKPPSPPPTNGSPPASPSRDD